MKLLDYLLMDQIMASIVVNIIVMSGFTLVRVLNFSLFFVKVGAMV